MTAGICAFILALIWLYPIQFTKIQWKPKNTIYSNELETLFRFRSLAQVSQLQEINMESSKWRPRIDEALYLSTHCGIAITPLIDHIISCERDERTLFREFQNRSSTAYGASATLILMPILMWIIGVAIGVDIFSFLASILGILILTLGVGLTLLSRLVIKLVSNTALKNLKPGGRRTIKTHSAAILVFVVIFTIQSSYFGFLVAVLGAAITHAFWDRIPQIDIERARIELHSSQHFHLVYMAGLIDAGLPWLKVLSYIDENELQRIARRIEMGVDPEIAFSHSSNWQAVGKLIATSLIKGTRLSSDLRLLSTEYRELSLTYRIQQVEKIAGRLIIPVNLLQLPAFILMGLVPLVGPLILQTLETFHI